MLQHHFQQLRLDVQSCTPSTQSGFPLPTKYSRHQPLSGISSKLKYVGRNLTVSGRICWFIFVTYLRLSVAAGQRSNSYPAYQIHTPRNMIWILAILMRSEFDIHTFYFSSIVYHTLIFAISLIDSILRKLLRRHVFERGIKPPYQANSVYAQHRRIAALEEQVSRIWARSKICTSRMTMLRPKRALPGFRSEEGRRMIPLGKMILV